MTIRRMPAERRLSTLITSGAPVETHLSRLARMLAGFHSRTGCATSTRSTTWPEAHTVTTNEDPDESAGCALDLIGAATAQTRTPVDAG